MAETNGFRQLGDIGGPMNIGNGYRWNVPVLTYGFDKSFLDFFGTNGVAAVESAIQVFNDLPPASEIVITNYPLDSQEVNYQAEAQNLYDLKSATLTLLLEQVGLTQPARYIFAIHQWNPLFLTYPTENNWPNGTIPNYIVQRNFDPETFASSVYVNGSLYVGSTFYQVQDNYAGRFNIVVPNQANPLMPAFTAVADSGFSDTVSGLSPGISFAGLTEDDVGGLCYLLSTNNIAYETLLPNISSICTNFFVNGAWRPGVDKITFVRQPFDSLLCQFLPMTNQFTDTYITNGNVMHQQLERVITQPDFLFCAGDVNYGVPLIPFVDRTGTTNWVSNAALNGNPANGGPGIIRPQIKIVFNKLGHQLYGSSDQPATDAPFFWGSFDSSISAPIHYPQLQNVTNNFTVRLWLAMGSFPNRFQKNFDWLLTNSVGSVSLFQTSTNLTDWLTLFSVTNDGTTWFFENDNPPGSSRFYRVTAQ
jgi:hypothetical protein